MFDAAPFALDLPAFTACGSFTATNGSPTLVGATSLVKSGDQLLLQHSANYMGLASVDSTGGNVTLTGPWEGVTATGILYKASEAISDEAIEFLSRNDELGTLAGRATYDAQPDGYTYLAVDGTPAFYVRRGTAAGVWYDASTDVFIWVSTAGDDVNGDGSFASPLKTINAAISAIVASDDWTGFNVYLVLKAGVYNTQNVILKDVKGAPASLRICGETALGGTLNMAAVIVASPSGDAISAINLKSAWTILGLTVGGPGQKGHCLLAKAARLRFNQINFAKATGAHIACLANGSIALSNLASGNFYAIGDVANAHWLVNGSGAAIDIQAETTSKPAITCGGGVSFATAFAWARASGQIFTGTGINFVTKGNITGRRWRAEQNSSIDSGQSGENYLPGKTAGVAVKNGEYL